MVAGRRLTLLLQWAVVAAVLAYYGHSKWQSYTQDKERKAKNARDLAALVDSLHKLAVTHKATVDWEARLSGSSSVRMSPIMSAELRAAWPPDTPILFVGILEDIGKNPDGTYQVLLKYDELSGSAHFLSTDLLINATCSSDLALPLLAMAKSESRLGLTADVALVGAVTAIASQQVRGSEGGETTELVGKSTCLAARVLNEMLPPGWWSLSRAQ